ncbi:MAG: PHP-associated domain-containing protein [Nitrososphaerota archaeon]
MQLLKSELHCHNNYSNFNVGDLDAPYDCNITIKEQLEKSYRLGLDVLFVTNHKTLDGNRQMLEYKKAHPKYQNIKVYPAEEVTIDTGAHVLVYGNSECIRPRLSLGEVIDEARAQNAITSAPHPFSILDALREQAKSCDLIEVFNSNNVDMISNVKAVQFAQKNNMVGVAGSDSHVLSTLGRCVNVIESENTLDDILSAMKKGKIQIQKSDYASGKETLEHIKYKINNSKDYISEYIAKYYPRYERLFTLLLKIFEMSQNNRFWLLIYQLAIMGLKRMSNKINLQNYDSSILREKNLGTYCKLAFS